MITNRQVYGTNFFTSKFAYLGLLSSFVTFAALCIAPFFSQTLLDKGTSAKVGETSVVTEFDLEPRPIGALRVNADAVIPTNHWVVYEIKLVDEQGNILVSAIKEAWEESGTWQEGGESGSWHEQDLKAGLDIKGDEKQKVKLLLTVLGYGTGNTELEARVSFDVQVINGAVDTRHLWPALIGSSVLGILGLVAVPLSGQQVMTKTVFDSDPTAREQVGGKDKLIRVNVAITADSSCPHALKVQLTINDAHGEQIYRTSERINMKFTKSDGIKTGAKGHLQAFFIIEPRSSYGFHVEVTPDASVDITTLKVQEGTYTRQGISVTHLTQG